MTGKQKTALAVCVFLFVSQVFGETKRRCISPAAAKRFVETNRKEVQNRREIRSRATRNGNIIWLEADSELLILSNTFDLQDLAVRFHPASKGRYTHTLEPASFDGETSQTLDLGDDDSFELVFKDFQFPFGRKTYDRCYINSNGSITFENADPEPPSVNVISQDLPRIAGFFADLNPQNSGAILLHETSDRVLISWLRVPEFFNQNQFDFGQNTFQIVLYKTGVIDIVFTNEFTATQGIVGLIPGFDSIPVHLVDFSSRLSTGRQFHSLVENFHNYESIDIPSLMKALYSSEPDRFDFVSIFSNFDLTPVPGAQAFAINVRNNVLGIGNPSDRKPIFKDTEKYGSSGQLQNITFLGNIHQYPDDPGKNIPEEDVSLLEILAHELGHRWLSYIKTSRDGELNDTLLGRDKSHWSFFLDSDGSFLEGNQIQLRSSNSFETGTPFQQYSDLDLYLMGFKSPEEVSDTFYVEGANNFSPDFPFSTESSPESDIRFKGTPVRISIADIIDANGPRKPESNESQREFKHLFLLIAKSTQQPTAEEIAYMEMVRASWTDYFYNATSGAATIDTVLDQ